MPPAHITRPLQETCSPHYRALVLTVVLTCLPMPAIARAHQEHLIAAPASEFVPATNAKNDFNDADFAQADQPEFGDRRGGVTFLIELIAGLAFAFITSFFVGLVLGLLVLLFLLLRYAAEWVVDWFRSAAPTPDGFRQPID